MPGGKYWTAQQNMELAQLLSSDRIDAIAEKLGRSPDSIRAKVRRDGITPEARRCTVCGRQAFRRDNKCERCHEEERNLVFIQNGLKGQAARSQNAEDRLSRIIIPKFTCSRCYLKFDREHRVCQFAPHLCDYCHVETKCSCVEGKEKEKIFLELHSVEMAVGSINRDAVGPGVFIGA